MADIAILDVSGITDTDVGTTATLAGALAASQTVPCGGKDTRLLVVVANGSATYAATVTVKAPTTGGGERVKLGDQAYEVAAGKTAIIDLSDSARFKELAGASAGKITITGAIAAGGTIGDCKIWGIQS